MDGLITDQDQALHREDLLSKFKMFNQTGNALFELKFMDARIM